jgi:hypothetical protein
MSRATARKAGRQALLVEVEDMLELLAVAYLPGLFPEVRQLVEFGVAGGGVEAKHARGRNGRAVELGDTQRQPIGLGGLLADLAELGEQEVVCWPFSLVLTPCEGLRSEGWHHFVDCFVGFVLPFAHHEVVLSRCDLQSISIGCGRYYQIMIETFRK